MKFLLIVTVTMATMVWGLDEFMVVSPNPGYPDDLLRSPLDPPIRTPRPQVEDCQVGGHSVPVGDKYYPAGNCVEMTCTAPDNFSIKGCPAISGKCAPIPGDPIRTFPACCPVVPETC